MEKFKAERVIVLTVSAYRRMPSILAPLVTFLLACVLATSLLSPFEFISKRQNSLQKFSNSWDNWKDDTWPIRQPMHWDISTDFPYPRKLEFDVINSGTWIRLDVHPASSEIVFDMLGDLYCLPANAISTQKLTNARPILRGIPHDSDPHFSPNGESLIFTSDAISGVQNIWTMPWSSCDDMDIGQNKTLAYTEAHQQEPASSCRETRDQKTARLLSEGRLYGIVFCSAMMVLADCLIS